MDAQCEHVRCQFEKTNDTIAKDGSETRSKNGWSPHPDNFDAEEAGDMSSEIREHGRLEGQIYGGHYVWEREGLPIGETREDSADLLKRETRR